MDYKDSLNLPKTDFPMKANLPVLEEEILKYWDSIDVYNKLLKEREDKELYVLHDGPPYANGHIHIGTAFNKILKDFIIKYKSIRGYKTPYIPGWDCHGMPIEHNVTKELGPKLKETSVLELRKKCRDYASKFVNTQKVEFKRLGVFGDWDNPYITMSNDYEADIVDNFGKLVEKGFIYRGLRPIHWCMKCQTALAGNEIEYEDKESPSIFVKFKFEDEDKFFLIWTTTPWTLPANVAIAFHPDEKYVEVESSFGKLVMMKKLVQTVKEKLKDEKFKIVEETDSKKYIGKKYIHPIDKNKKGKVITADFVTTDVGTGIVHIAPGHGYDDYQAGIKNDLEIVCPVNKEGKFFDEIKKYGGMNVFEANPHIIEDLKNEGSLIFAEKIIHSYPVCWRCKSELIFRATEQWFLDVEKNNLRNNLLSEIDNTKWIPVWSKDRIYNMVKTRPDWCLSRQRSWGVPIPVFYCKKCSTPHIKKETIDKIRDIILKEGSDIWFEKDVSYFAKDLKCEKCGSTEFEKETNIFDVWFDSSLSHSAVVKKRKELRWPSDLYLEAVDQHRGWFQVSLIVSTATDGKAPYKEVLTHGLILDKNMKKMSKSLGNVFSPETICKKYGAEIIRLWFSSVDYTSDAPFGEELLSSSKETYFKIRNTIRFMLGNLGNSQPEDFNLTKEDLHPIDRYILANYVKMRKRIIKNYDDYEFHKVFKEFYSFIVTDLSSFYLDIVKDRLYTYPKNSKERKSGLFTLYILLDDMLKLIAPIIPFTVEQAYKYFNKKSKKESIHFEILTDDIYRFEDENILKDFEILNLIREKVLSQLEKLRSENVIGKSIEANLLIKGSNECSNKILEKYKDILFQLFIVSNVKFVDNDGEPVEKGENKFVLKSEKAEEKKCARCWLHLESVGKHSDHPELCDKCYDAVKMEE
ncbi:MAG: isoleucine--tRNA ligase [candidate division WOR-3 bacterium]